MRWVSIGEVDLVVVEVVLIIGEVDLVVVSGASTTTTSCSPVSRVSVVSLPEYPRPLDEC